MGSHAGAAIMATNTSKVVDREDEFRDSLLVISIYECVFLNIGYSVS